jgi:hypothetical protein
VAGYVHSGFQKNLITNKQVAVLVGTVEGKNVIENGKHIRPKQWPACGSDTHPSEFLSFFLSAPIRACQFAYYVNTSNNFLSRLRQMSVVCQRSIQCDTKVSKVFGMINMLYLSISEIDVQHSVGIMRTEMKDARCGLSWIRLKSPTTKIPIQPFEVSFTLHNVIGVY